MVKNTFQRCLTYLPIYCYCFFVQTSFASADIATKKQIQLDPRIQQFQNHPVSYILAAQTEAELNNYNRALESILKIDPSNNTYASIKTKLIFKYLVQSELYQSAWEHYRQNIQNLKISNDAEIDEIKMQLVHGLIKRTDLTAAKSILFELATTYPLTPISQKSYDLYNEIYCKNNDYEELWSSSTKKQNHSRNILLRALTENPEHTFAQVLGTTPSSTPNYFLDSADFFLQTRQYEKANQILIQSKNAEKTLDSNQRYKFLSMLGRSFNGLNKPEKALEYYQEAIKKYPNHPEVMQLKIRYFTTLHLAKKYREAFKQRQQAARVFKSQKQHFLLASFWSLYLSKDLTQIEKFGKALLKSNELNEHAQVWVKYWLAKNYEHQKSFQKALEIYHNLFTNFRDSPYSLLAGWRITALEPQSFLKLDPTQKPKLILAKQLPEENKNDFPIIQKLVDAKLCDYAELEIRSLQLQLSDRQKIIALSKLSEKCENYKTASLSVRRWWNRFQSPIKTKEQWEKEIAENQKFWEFVYSRPYEKYILNAAQTFQISPLIVWSIMRKESNYEPTAKSGMGALGLMQIIPRTGTKIAQILNYPQFNPTHLTDPQTNIQFGTWYLSRLSEYFSGNILLAIAAYNAGPEAVVRWLKDQASLEIDEFIENIPYPETKNYVLENLYNINTYSQLYPELAYSFDIRRIHTLPQTFPDLEIF